MSRNLNPNRTNLRSSGKRENERPDGGLGVEGGQLFLDVGYFSIYSGYMGGQICCVISRVIMAKPPSPQYINHGMGVRFLY
jgi:hypothetical protein